MSNLNEFNSMQIAAVEKTAAGLLKLFTISPWYDVEAGAEQCIKNNPLLKAVSVRELTLEVLKPGSFRQSHLGEVCEHG